MIRITIETNSYDKFHFTVKCDKKPGAALNEFVTGFKDGEWWIAKDDTGDFIALHTDYIKQCSITAEEVENEV